MPDPTDDGLRLNQPVSYPAGAGRAVGVLWGWCQDPQKVWVRTAAGKEVVRLRANVRPVEVATSEGVRDEKA